MYSLLLLTMLFPSLYFIDAIRRIGRTKIQNNTISMKAVLILGFAFFFEVVAGSLNFFLATKAKLWTFIVALLSFIFAFGILGFILFRIGILAV